VHTLLTILFIVVVIKLITFPFRFFGRRRYYDGYSGRGFGHRRHRFGGLGTILTLVALDRLFGGRRW
jgi:hypothetical protein